MRSEYEKEIWSPPGVSEDCRRIHGGFGELHPSWRDSKAFIVALHAL